MKHGLIVALISASAAACTPGTAQASPTECDAKWTDQARGNRVVPVRIRMPEGSDKVPLILFSHGLGGSLDSGTTWAKHWAEAGFAVVTIQHSGSDSAVIGPEMFKAMNAEQLIARARDVSFVISTLPERAREGKCDLSRIDLARIGMSGHSFGAITAQAVSGEIYPAGTLANPRIKATVAFSPSPPTRGSASDAFAKIAIPFFSVTGTKDEVRLTPFNAADRVKPYEAMPAGGKYLLVIADADHLALGGRSSSWRREDTAPPRMEALVDESTTDFWRWTLMGDTSAKARLDAFGKRIGPGDRFEHK